MAREGMDAGAVRQVAAQLEQDATAVDHVVAAVDGLFQSIERDWKGSDSARLHEQWVGQRRGEFTALAAALRNMATVARSNATDQDKASGVGASASGALGGLGPIFGSGSSPILGGAVRPILRQGLGGPVSGVVNGHLIDGIGGLSAGLSTILGLPQIPKHIVEDLQKVGLKSWATSADNAEGKSIDSVVNFMEDHGVENAASKLGHLGTALDVGSKVMGGVHITTDMVKIYEDGSSGNWSQAAENGSDALSAGLKMGGPTMRLAGFDVALWTDVVKAAGQIDGTPIPAPWTGDAWSTVWVPGLESGFKEAGKEIWGAIW